jgi:undecaprenyl-diphosphatase
MTRRLGSLGLAIGFLVSNAATSKLSQAEPLATTPEPTADEEAGARGPAVAEKTTPPSESAPSPHTLGGDFVDLLEQGGQGFLNQFTHVDSLLLLGASAAVVGVVLATEDGYQESIEDANLVGSGGQKVGDVLGVALAMPIVPLGAYAVGRLAEDDKLTHFAIELSATYTLASLETVLISQVPVHERPVVDRGEESNDDQAFFNRAFRGASSLPSGHTVGAAVLMFKSFEWYGPWLGIPTGLVAGFVGYARIEEGRHYVSDVVAAFALAGLASLGTSRARDVWSHLAGHEFALSPYVNGESAGFTVSGHF